MSIRCPQVSFVEVQMSVSLQTSFDCLPSDDIISAVLSKQRAAISDGDTLPTYLGSRDNYPSIKATRQEARVAASLVSKLCI